jgi:hypothetical protein
MLVSAAAETNESRYHRHVVWLAGKEPRALVTSIISPDREEQFTLAISPLWAVEGGIVALEILATRPERPHDNLLGHYKVDVPQPFVVTVEELEGGLSQSRFGRVRYFKLEGATLRVEIEAFRLGEGVGDCKDCKNIQELTVDFAFENIPAGRTPRPMVEAGSSAGGAPASWHELDTGAFSILAPTGWEFYQLCGVDSYIGEFVGDGVVLTFDFGRYSSGYLGDTKKPEYVIIHKPIGGFPAKIASPRTAGHGITGVYFRKVGRSDGLCLYGENLASTQQELALKVFETIRFRRPEDVHINVVPYCPFPPPPPPKTAQ